MSDRITEFTGKYGNEKMYIIDDNIDICKLSKQSLINMLGEKEDEIEMLKDDYNNLLELTQVVSADTLRIIEKQIKIERSKICNKIKEQAYPYRFVSGEPKSYIINEDVLDKIEKGE